jgi:ribonuclease R
LKGTPEKMQSKDLQDFMLRIKGQPGEMVLSTMLLRSMQQARYDEDNLGHFGLAASTIHISRLQFAVTQIYWCIA